MSFKERIMFKIFMSMIKKSTDAVPPPLYDRGMVQDYDVEMSDGTKLLTHIYFPDKAGKFPVILVRSPYVYGLDIQKMIFTEYIKYGFILCYQEVRGRGESEGLWQPFENEMSDTKDTLNWLKGQKFASKGVALLGNSYLSSVHLAALDGWGSLVKTAFLPVYGDNLYDVVYENEMLKKDFAVIWSLQNNETKNLEKEEFDSAYKKAMNAVPFSSAMKEAGLDRVDFFDNVVSHPKASDPYWDKFKIPSSKNITVPVCLVSGWYDFSVKGQMRIFENLSADVKNKSRFIIGPWNHSLMNNGDLKTPNHNITGIAALALGLEWFMHIFYGLPQREDFIYKYYEVAGGGYKCSRALPETKDERFYFGSGALVKEAIDGDEKLSFRHDPQNPFKTCGGGGLSPRLIPKKGEPKQYNALQEMDLYGKAVRFESAPFDSDKSYFGAGQVKLRFSSDCPDTAIHTRLCLKKGKKEYFIASAIAALSSLAKNYNAGDIVEVSLDLSPVSFAVKKGWAVSLIVSGADYPSFESHNNGTDSISNNTIHLKDSFLILKGV